jgi:hypothetical protein
VRAYVDEQENEVTDRELLEAAAKAAGMRVNPQHQSRRDACGAYDVGLWIVDGPTCWNPLADDGDALKLAVNLKLHICPGSFAITVAGNGAWESVSRQLMNDEQATRRAIVRAAAALAVG